MSGVRYIARSKLIAGHVAGETYFLPVGFTDATRSREVDKTKRTTLSGKLETRHHYSKSIWSLTLQPLNGARVDQLQEFLESVQIGDRFTVFLYDDTYGEEFIRVDDAHTLRPFLRAGDRHKDHYQATPITVREP